MLNVSDQLQDMTVRVFMFIRQKSLLYLKKRFIYLRSNVRRLQLTIDNDYTVNLGHCHNFISHRKYLICLSMSEF